MALSISLKPLFSKEMLPTLILVGFYVVLFFIAWLALPSAEQMIEHFSRLYQRFGYQILFTAALLEALVAINFLAPGQLTIVLGIIFAKQGQAEITFVVLTVVLGALCGYILDYALGYYGFSNLLKK